jgi:hypothetical protein
MTIGWDTRPSWIKEVKIVCNWCKGLGHIARFCPRKVRQESYNSKSTSQILRDRLRIVEFNYKKDLEKLKTKIDNLEKSLLSAQQKNDDLIKEKELWTIDNLNLNVKTNTVCFHRNCENFVSFSSSSSVQTEPVECAEGKHREPPVKIPCLGELESSLSAIQPFVEFHACLKKMEDVVKFLEQEYEEPSVDPVSVPEMNYVSQADKKDTMLLTVCPSRRLSRLWPTLSSGTFTVPCDDNCKYYLDTYATSWIFGNGDHYGEGVMYSYQTVTSDDGDLIYSDITFDDTMCFSDIPLARKVTNQNCVMVIIDFLD